VSGGLVALVTGFLSLAAGSDTVVVPVGARWLVIVAMLAFVVSTCAALVINMPSEIVPGDADALEGLVNDHWQATGWDQQVAQRQVGYLKSLRSANKEAAGWLTAAIGAEIVGIAFTAALAVVVVLNLPRP